MFLFPIHVTTDAGSWLSAWHLDPVLAPVFVAVGTGYLLAYRVVARTGSRPPPAWRVAAFYGGLAALATALLGPPDHFNEALFSVHMGQHLLLMLVAAPLLVLGRPVHLFLQALPARPRRLLLRTVLGHRFWRRMAAWLLHPLSVFVLYNGSFLLWHVPALYQAAVVHPLVHELEHASFFFTALLFWQALVDPRPWRRRLSSEATLVLLFATWTASDLVCATITLSSTLLYPVYAGAPKPWGLTPLGDQRLGGALMWVTGGVLYVALLLGYLVASTTRRTRTRAAPEGTPHGRTAP